MAGLLLVAYAAAKDIVSLSEVFAPRAGKKLGHRGINRVKGIVLAYTIMVAFVLAGVATAQTPSPSPPPSNSPSPAASVAPDLGAERVDEFFTKPHISADVFAASFLSQVPASMVEEIVNQLKAGLGNYKGVKKSLEKNEAPFPPTWGRYLATFAKGTDDVYIRFDNAERIDGLLFRPPKLAAASLQDALRRLAALPGEISYVVLEGRS